EAGESDLEYYGFVFEVAEEARNKTPENLGPGDINLATNVEFGKKYIALAPTGIVYDLFKIEYDTRLENKDFVITYEIVDDFFDQETSENDKKAVVVMDQKNRKGESLSNEKLNIDPDLVEVEQTDFFNKTLDHRNLVKLMEVYEGDDSD